MPTQVSPTHFSIPARNVRQLPLDKAKGISQKTAMDLGIGVSDQKVAREMAAYASGMDAIQSNVTTPQIPGVIQFLQNWLPGQVHILTAARKIDELIGIATIGAYEDEQVVQEVLENTGYAEPYGDITNLPLSDWNLSFVTRTVVRFELGMRVGNLEEARAARVRVNSGESKRQSCGIALEIARNLVGFNGYNSGNDNTYGFLNDPNLPGYVTVATGASSSTLWSKKTSLEIQTDILTSLVGLRVSSQEVIDPYKTPITLAVATNVVDYLSVSSTFNISTKDWLAKNYPNVRVVSAPQLNGANGGANVFYTYADTIDDGISSDDRRTFIQVVPAQFMVTGVQKLAKGYEEDYTNATAGIMLKRPWAVNRSSGV